MNHVAPLKVDCTNMVWYLIRHAQSALLSAHGKRRYHARILNKNVLIVISSHYRDANQLQMFRYKNRGVHQRSAPTHTPTHKSSSEYVIIREYIYLTVCNNRENQRNIYRHILTSKKSSEFHNEPAKASIEETRMQQQQWQLHQQHTTQ